MNLNNNMTITQYTDNNIYSYYVKYTFLSCYLVFYNSINPSLAWRDNSMETEADVS